MSRRAPARTKPRPTAGRRDAPARPRRRRWRRWLLAAAAAALLLPLALAGLLYVLVGIPDPSDAATAQSAIVLDRDGRAVGRIHAGPDRVDVPLVRVPQHTRDAVLAAEDRGFYEHRGISIPSIVRAAFTNLSGGEVRQGGSTITQQYVKNAFVGRDRSYIRKLREAVVALKIERRLSKDEILERYLNTIYYGRGAYGIEAAARTFFGKPARRLELAEGALLAGMIRAPEALDPARARDVATRRRDEVLDSMSEIKAISPETAARAKDEPLGVRPVRAGGFAPYFMDDVRRALEDELGPGRLYRSGLRIQTTLDASMQRAAERAVASVLDRPDDPDVALVAIDPATGGVRAMVGGRDYAARQLNLASRGRRQPGSAFKPFVLAAAMAEGIPPTRRYRAPAEITIPDRPRPWKVGNFDGRGHGTIDLVRATEQSVNTVYAQLIEDVGPEKVAEIARAAGVRTKLQEVLSLALGTSVVSPLELANAYATFANRGVFAPAHLVERVTDARGEVLYERDPAPRRAIDRAVADNVNAVLQSVVRAGTGKTAALPRPAAGKTGTTERHTDAWFAGYTPNLVTSVWMGYADGGRTMEDVRGIEVVGSSFPAQIWRAFMLEAAGELPSRRFVEPRSAPATKKPRKKEQDTSASPSPTPSPSPSPTASPS